MNPIIASMQKVRESLNKGKLTLELKNASNTTIRLITENGGRIEAQVWHQTCHSGPTCACNSHPSGFELASVAIPSAWQEGIDTTKYAEPDKHLFKGVHENDRLLFVIPDEKTGPRAVVERQPEFPWYRYVLSLHPRPELL